MLAVLLLLGCGVLAAGRLLESESETRSPARVAAAQPTEEPVKSKFRCEIGTSASGITLMLKGRITSFAQLRARLPGRQRKSQ